MATTDRKSKRTGDRGAAGSLSVRVSAIESLADQRYGGGMTARFGRAPIAIGAALVGVLVALGIFASNGWLPRTDALTGQRYGWFGSKLAKNAPSNWNPFAAPPPSPTPQLAKEYIYAGSRLLAVEDANANAAPPADLAIWRPSSGIWYILPIGGGPMDETFISFQWGLNGDVAAPADFDGDGKTDFCVFRPGNTTWYIVHSSDQSYNFPVFGLSTDKPAPADYDGDGKSDVAVFRPSDGKFYIFQTSTSSMVSYQVGQSGDKIAPADHDGDGKADACVWRHGSPGQFRCRYSTDGQIHTQNLGSASTDEPASADYDGDGKADFALLRGNVWTIYGSAAGVIPDTTWQNAGDLPVESDYDADGKCDIAVFRPANGTWYIKKSSDGQTIEVQWGMNGDYPVPAYYKH